MSDNQHSSQDDRSAVRLSDVLFEMEGQIDEWSAFVNLKTGQVVSLSDEAFQGAEASETGDEFYGDADSEMIALALEIERSDDFKALPSKFEIHEWAIMRDFCATVKDESAQRELFDAIHGSGAFRFFKSTIDRLGLRDAWFAYRDESIEQIAIDWLEANDIQWRRDKPS